MNTEVVNAEVNPEAEIRILKTANCPSLSGRSTLTYQVGCNAQSEIQFQILLNSANGFFNNDWVPQSAIHNVLSKQPKGKPITSATFRSIFPGKSVNSSGFLLAVLKGEGLVLALEGKQRGYELCDPTAFIEGVNALIEAAPSSAVVPLVGPAKKVVKLTPKGKGNRT